MNDAYWDLAARLVPDHGPADTVQGELVRAVLRLTAECCRNGCGNWDDYMEALAQFASDRFAEGGLEPALAGNAQSVLERLRRYGRMVRPDGSGAEEDAGQRPGRAEDDRLHHELCRDLADPLEAAAVRWCAAHPALIPFRPGPEYGALE